MNKVLIVGVLIALVAVLGAGAMVATITGDDIIVPEQNTAATGTAYMCDPDLPDCDPPGCGEC
jgi:hypothetical protein